MNKENRSVKIQRLLIYLYLLFSFGILDAWLRVMTRWIGAYSIYAPAPNLFTLLWSALFAAAVMMLSRKVGRVVYAVLYTLFVIYAIVQYGAYLILGKFLFISDFLYAGEGTAYFSFVVEHITGEFLFQCLLLILIGAIGIWFIGHAENLPGSKKVGWGFALIFVTAILGIHFVPGLYESGTAGQWDDFRNPALEYERFTNANYDLELTGMYQYIFKDAEIQRKRSKQVNTENLQIVDAYFAQKPEHSSNSMTGIFKDKNLIVVMMESVDDWLINEVDTPAIHYMMEHGICFSNMYVPGYSNGYTFNTEFAFNTSTYPYSNGNVAYSLSHNEFSSSIANRFKENGYETESFHKGTGDFYNRAEMHEAFGYSEYNCYAKYSEDENEEILRRSDTYVVENELLYQDIVNDVPFFSFIITYSAHLPYSDEDLLTEYALNMHPEYDTDQDREMSILKAKTRLTDDMFAGLLRRLEKDDLLQDTVIVGFADHYVYGLNDKERLQNLSEAAGSKLLEKIPAFIYCADIENSLQVDKVMQTTDLAPTILNLFDIEVPKDIMGQDIFTESYRGYAVFPGNTWLTNQAYMKNGMLQWNDGMTNDEIAQMNAHVQKVYQINDLILDTDYYRNKDR